MPDVVICRTCITECEKFKSIHGKGLFLGELTTLSQLLCYMSGIEIVDEDFMPFMCLKCIKLLISSFVFKRMVIEANEQLLSEKLNLIDNETIESIVKSETDLKPEILKVQEETTVKESEIITDVPLQFENVEIIDSPKKETSTSLDPEDCSKKKSQKLSNPKWQCQICHKQLSNQYSYKYHLQLHSDETPYLCSLCGEGFKTRNSYEGHLVVHDPNNPNTCSICGKAYRQSSSLRTHMLVHSGEKPFKCNICGKGMTQKSGFKKHMLIHSGEKPHNCDICGRDFRYSSNLIAHRRSHLSNKEFECISCQKCFTTADQLKRHSIVHKKDRPFSCDICGKNFKRRSSFASHYHIHEAT